MNIEEARSKTDSELRYELERMKRDLFELRFKGASDTTGNTAQIRTVRRSVARVETILHERTQGIRGQEPR